MRERKHDSENDATVVQRSTERPRTRLAFEARPPYLAEDKRRIATRKR
jgi:hypothetical protein